MAKSENDARVVGARVYRLKQGVQVHVVVDTTAGRKSLVYNAEAGNLSSLSELQVAQKLFEAERAGAEKIK